MTAVLEGLLYQSPTTPDRSQGISERPSGGAMPPAPSGALSGADAAPLMSREAMDPAGSKQHNSPTGQGEYDG